MVGYILQIKIIITCFWVHNCFSPVLSICQGQGSLRWSYSAFLCAWYLDSKSVGWGKPLLRKTDSQHSCCMLYVIHCKYCMLYTCISLKMKNIGSYTHKNLVSFLPIVGTDRGMLDIIPFLFFLKWILLYFSKKLVI